MGEPVFLSLAEIVEIHKNQMELYGGSIGIRGLHLLQSALAQPEASFSGEWLHGNLFEMAAAYAYHICQNHPFVDGNKRTALAAALVFLEINGISIADPKQKLLNAMLLVAGGSMSKQAFANILKHLPQR